MKDNKENYIKHQILFDNWIKCIEALGDKNINYHILKILCKCFRKLKTTQNIIKGSRIIRVRIVKEDDNIFHKEYHTYPPLDKIKDYGRFNFPNNSMFYGVIETEGENSYYNALMTALTEIIPDISNKNISYKKNIVYSIWEVIEDFNIIKYIKEVTMDVNKISDLYNIEEELKFYNYFSDLFRKKNDGNNNLYKKTATFVRILMKSSKVNIDGIMYKSVRSEDSNIESFNICLNPRVVDNNLKLIKIIPCTLEKIKDKTEIKKDPFEYEYIGTTL